MDERVGLDRGVGCTDAVEEGSERSVESRPMEEMEGVVGVVGDMGVGMGRGVRGAVSLAMRLSINVRKVKETLCAGDDDRVSRISDWACSAG